MSGGGRRVVVTGVGVVSPLGSSITELGAALSAGRRGLSPVELFELNGLGARRAGEIKGFAPETYLGKANFRPLDRTSRLATVAAQLALADGGLADDAARGEREIGLVLGTLFGSLRTIAEFDRRGLTAGPQYVKPMDFANSVINAAAGQTAIWHRLTGVNSTLTGGPTAGLQALAYAADLIRSGRAEAVLAGGADEVAFESYLGFTRAGLVAPGGEDERAVPFDARRNGFVPAEGAALLLLEEAGSARRRGARVRAEITGHGTAFDPGRGADGATAVARAIRLALSAAGAGAGGLAAVASGASGSAAGDRQEAAGLAAALGEASARVPVTAPKGALGEAFGASGALAAAVLLGAMESGTLPGIAGLEATEEGFPLAGVTAAARAVDLHRGLVTALGLDGNAAAVVLERAGAGGGA